MEQRQLAPKDFDQPGSLRVLEVLLYITELYNVDNHNPFW